MLKKVFFLSVFFPAVLFSQNEVDALRYSQIGFGGTARFTSMAGAFGALGGDASCLSFNPGGIGIYRKSEFNFTPSLYNQSITSRYNNGSSSDLKSNFNFSNIALIATKVNEKNDENNVGWVATSLGLAFNKTNNFSSRVNITGRSDYSMLNTMVNNANGYSPEELDPFAEALAYNLSLIRKDSTGNTYTSNIPAGISVLQNKQIETSGGMSEFDISYGGNFANKLYIGGSLGFTHLRYNETSSFRETDDKDSISDLNYYIFDNNLNTSGSGVNLKFGLIYRLNDWFRIGGAIHTPTFWGMKDSYSSSMTVNDPNYPTVFVEKSDPGAFDYSLKTPYRAIASAGFILKKKALVGIDYEYLNYGSAYLSSSPNVFADQNTAINAKYTNASNIRIGGEYRIDPFSLRMGYAYYGNPYNAGVGNEVQKNTISFGAGIKAKGFYVDGALVLTYYDDKYYLYEGADPVSNSYSSSGILVTVGFKY